MTKFSFKKAERLKSRKVIQRLFNREGESFGHYPLRVVWLFVEGPRNDAPVQFAVSVPKRQFRRAVHRNRVKRLVREAYRLNKHRLHRALEAEERQLALMVIYIGKEELPFADIEKAMRGMLGRWIKKYAAGK